MKTIHGTRIEKAAGTDRSRPSLCDPHVTVDGEGNAFLCATDSYQLVLIPVDLDEGDVPGYVPVDAITSARKLKREEIRLEADAAVVEDGTFVGSEAKYARNPGLGGKERTFPKVLDLVEMAGKKKTEATIGLNVKMLARMAAAMGSDTVKLTIRGERDAIGVSAPDRGTRTPMGLLMPVIVK